MKNRSSLSLAGKAATLAVALAACAPALAETRLVSAYFSHRPGSDLNGGLSNPIQNTAIGRAWSGHDLYVYPTGGNLAPESEVWASVDTRLATDGFSLVSHLRTRLVNTGFFQSLSANVAVQFHWIVEVVGQNETFTLDAPTENDTNADNGSRSVCLSGSIWQGGAACGGAGFQQSITLSPGRHTFSLVQHLGDSAFLANRTLYCNYATSLHFTNLTIAPGALQNVPVMPGPGGSFTNVRGLAWFDPPMAQGYTFTATGTSLFKDIMAFPAGIEGTYYITTEGSTYGPFTPEDSVNFPALVGHSVSSFVLNGIKPFVDGASPTAFPIMLDFSEPTASFTMLPIPAPEIQLEPLANGDLKLIFTGVLQSSPDLAGWADVTPAPVSPYIIPNAQITGKKYFRARD